MPDGARAPSEIAEDTTAIRTYGNAYVQGLLQTRAYTEAVIGNSGTLIEPQSFS